MDSWTGQTVGRYTLEEPIARGGAARIYRAYDNQLLRSVAVKIAFTGGIKKTAGSKQVLREAQIIARIEHARIVPVYDMLKHEDTVFIVMRLLSGQDLGSLVERVAEPMTPVDAWKIMREVMLGAGYAHANGVIHSDLKPGNIFITDSDEVLILDFGLSALLELERMEFGKIYGTPLYMSPEQINGHYVDARSDIYSLGVILYTLITGQHPFAGFKSMQDLLSSQREKVPERPDRLNGEIPGAFSECVMKALEKNPRDRYISCLDFCEALDATLPAAGAGVSNDYELRWDPRVDVEMQTQLYLPGENDPVDTTITNLSVSGASLTAPAPLTPGMSVRIRFDVLDFDSSVALTTDATVLWSAPRSDADGCDIGIQFEGLGDMDKKCLGLFIRNMLLHIQEALM